MALNIKNRHIKILLVFPFLFMLILPTCASAMTINVSIPEKFSEVNAGESVYFETEIKWPENDGRKDLRVEYTIKDKDDQEIAYSKVLKAVETQASFMDSIAIPDSTKTGIYKIVVNISDYQDLSQEVIASFNVVKGNDAIQTSLFIIIGVLGAIVLAVVIEIFILIKKSRVKID